MEIEKLITKELCQKKNLIISCGGGLATNEDNIKELRKNSKIVLLTAEKESVIQRITGNTNQTFSNTKRLQEKVEELMHRRKPQYQKACHFCIKTDNKKPNKIGEKIIDNIKNNKTLAV